MSRGIKCECVCPDPKCGRPLIARQGKIKIWHFAHAGGQGGYSCSGGETGLHKYAKQVLCESVGKVVDLPHKNNKAFYGGYHGMLRVRRGIPEALIPGTSRRCDVLLNGTVRSVEGRAVWKQEAKVAVEIAVTHYKDEAYWDEMRQAALVSVLEVPLSWKQVQKEADRLSKQYHEVVRHILLNQGNSKYWIFKRGGKEWECPSCRRFKHAHRTICYDCEAKHTTR